MSGILKSSRINREDINVLGLEEQRFGTGKEEDSDRHPVALTWPRWLLIPLLAQGHGNGQNTDSGNMEITSFLELFTKFSMVSKYPVLVLILLTNWFK